jgi:hypothetical protein
MSIDTQPTTPPDAASDLPPLHPDHGMDPQGTGADNLDGFSTERKIVPPQNVSEEPAGEGTARPLTTTTLPPVGEGPTGEPKPTVSPDVSAPQDF